MRLASNIRAVSLSLSLTSGAQQLPPLDYYLDEMALEGTNYQVLVFTSIPGVNHRVERSDDFQTWELVTGGIYGLGQDHAVALFEKTPSENPPRGGSNPPATAPEPLRSLSVALRPAQRHRFQPL